MIIAHIKGQSYLLHNKVWIKTLSVWGLERGNWIKKRINLSDLWGNKILNIDLLYIDQHYFSFLHNLLK